MSKRKMVLLSAAITAVILGCGTDGHKELSAEEREAAAEEANKYTYDPYPAPPSSEANTNGFLAAVNNARAAGATCGEYGYIAPMPPVTWHDGYYSAAYEHTQDVAATGLFGHAGSGTDTDWTAQVMGTGPSIPQGRMALNIGYHGGSVENGMKFGGDDPVELVNVWLSSPEHCKAMLSSVDFMGAAVIGDYAFLTMGI